MNLFSAVCSHLKPLCSERERKGGKWELAGLSEGEGGRGGIYRKRVALNMY